MSDFLFGSSPSTSESQLSALTKEQKALLNRLLGNLGSNADVQGLDTETYGLEPSQLELSSLAGLEQLVNQIPGINQENQQQVSDTSSAALSSFQDIFASGPQDIDAYFRATVQDPLLEQFSEEILPELQAKHAGSFFGGERRQAESRSREDLLDTLAQERTRVAFEEYNKSADRKVSAGQVLPGLGEYSSTADLVGPTSRAALLSSLFGTGQEVQNTRKSQLDERSRRVSELLNLLGVQGIENVVTAQEGSGGFLSSIAPSLISGAFSLSDERAKTKKKKIGRTDKGVPIYTYKYKADPNQELRMGVMAQELEKVDPSAVATVKGVKFVDLEAL